MRTELEQRLRAERQRGKKGFIPFVVAGDPDLETTEAVLLEFATSGASAIEVGVPFSDPVADGPVIQRAAERALRSGTHVAAILKMCARVRQQTSTPLVLFSYLNPLVAFGLERLAGEAAADGVSALLVVDLPFEAASGLGGELRANGMDLISLVTLTTGPNRLAKIAGAATGFMYAVSRRGVTGKQTSELGEAATMIAQIRQHTDLPLALGFGIRDGNDAAAAWEIADLAVVGSAVVEAIEQSNSRENAVTRVRQIAAEFQSVVMA